MAVREKDASRKGGSSDEATRRATGASLEEWAQIIRAAGLADASHKQIADFLALERGVPPWWAQQLTVGYERLYRARPVGATADGGFQIGVSRTFGISAAKLWDFLVSPRGAALISGDGPDAAETEPTTLRPYSHIRMRWRLPLWKGYSILQVRVAGGKDAESATITFHQEKLPDAAAREDMRRRWSEVLDALAAFDLSGDQGV